MGTFDRVLSSRPFGFAASHVLNFDVLNLDLEDFTKHRTDPSKIVLVVGVDAGTDPQLHVPVQASTWRPARWARCRVSML